MRILALENELTSTRGGQELSLLDVCRGLAARGHRLTLAYVAGGDLEAEYQRFCERMVKVRTYSVDRSQLVQSLRDFLASLTAVHAAAPDVIYANQYLDSLFAAVARRVYGAPFVCHLRLPPPDVVCRQYGIGLSQAVRLIATSEQTRSDWASAGYRADTIDVVYNGIEPDNYARRDGKPELRRTLGVPPDALVVGYAGRLHPAKGLETLLEGFGLVSRERRCHLLVAGRPAAMAGTDGAPRDYLRELRDLADRLEIASLVTWIDHQHDMSALLTACDAMVLPSLWSEPFGRIVIESMACETPVVASRVGGISEILSGEFAGWLFEAGRPDELAARLLEAVDRIAADPSMGRRARAHVVSRFSADRMIAGVEAVLVRAIDERGARSPALLAQERR
jgi:glycosyltransferase involved in cell wall biosynthesis